MNHLIQSIHLGSNVYIQGRGKHYQLQNMINKLTLNSVWFSGYQDYRTAPVCTLYNGRRRTSWRASSNTVTHVGHPCAVAICRGIIHTNYLV